MAQVETSVTEHILEIHIRRPEKLNALSLEMFHELCSALAELDGNPQLRVAVLHAEGKHFTAGVELDQWAPHFGSGDGFPLQPGGIDIFGLVGPRRRKPVIQAVQGYCFTWGVEMMLNMDIRIAAEDTQFAMLEVQRGLYPCGGATIRLPQQMGYANAQRFLLTGDRWTAAEAHRTGLVQEVVATGQQYNRAMELAGRIAKAAPLAVEGVMKAVHFAAHHSQDEAVEQMFADLVPVMQSEDADEGIQSFLERREAVFKGR
ncbi:crotonase/enoyl-CoA hydratase family protein [Pseudohalioglobus sediminis]|uniref:Crotonase/enoyl-CoA hydratase family protein n=1 Tax=Pseudohalioglobus sediminis TaxID=2606449 RepID=A0A5B0X3Y3_9GAMM|nr:crotonase/enoyl-CoA hydratase family protein [Pseudohalioglobus sediminis]KAA1193952.1 crotonase/enoyl-CoA hydratase family protein [Pseudohalioglobus sediminis]